MVWCRSVTVAPIWLGCCVSCCTWRSESGPGHPSDRRPIEPIEDHPQGRLRVYVHLVVFTITGFLRAQTALTVILLGFNNGSAGRMAEFAHTRWVVALSRCGELPGVRALAAAALRRAAAVRCGGSPRARRAAFWCVRRLFPPSWRGRSRAARRAGRALEYREESSHRFAR
jgi:hypothetical protein